MTVERVISEPMDQFPIGMRVLAVDDDPTCLLLLETLLRKCHYNVTATSQAMTALNLLRENKNKFDLVISDVHMPDMDGFKLLELVGLEMDLPVIMLSANGDTKLVMKGITHGACDYLLKPVRIEELRIIWQHVIRRKKLDRKDRSNSGEAAGIRDVVDQGVKLNKKRKDQKEDEDEERDEEDDNDDPSTQKKPRVVWSVELHRKFVAAVNHLGIDKAVPKKILDLMNEEKLTRENVASHLQKFRLYLRRISCVANQQANMFAALGSADSSFLQMESSRNGVGNFHTLAGPDQLHNSAFRSFPPSGVLGRLNTPGVLGIRGLPSPGMVQNFGSSSNNQGKLQSFVVPGNHNASILQGMPVSSELDQLRNNNGVGRSGQLPSIDSTTVFPVSGSYARGSSSSHLGITSNSLMLGGSSLHASNLRDSVSTMGFQNASTLSGFTSVAPASYQLQDQSQASPICYNVGQIIRSAPHEWNVPKENIPYQSNVPSCSINSLNTVNGDMAQLGQCLDRNNTVFNRNVGVDSVEVSNFVGPPIVQPRRQGSYIADNIGSLDDLASAMMKRDQDKGKQADGDFGGSAYFRGTCI